MKDKLYEVIGQHGYKLYEKSVRTLPNAMTVFVAENAEGKFVGFAGSGGRLCAAPTVELTSDIALWKPSWELFECVKGFPGFAPVPCNKKASFGTGDRLGLVTAAHISADSSHDIFPVVAQQSPRELIKTNRSFKSVMLDAFVGVLEAGWEKGYGADADHIKDQNYLTEAIDAGYTMYTLDVSDFLNTVQDIREQEASLSAVSRAVIKDFAGKTIAGYTLNETELTKSAIVFESSMGQVINFNTLLSGKLGKFDLEVSIDEGSRDTTPEDQAFVAEYLHRSDVEFASLAPKFPGEFQKGIEYMGDRGVLEGSMRIHGALCQSIGGYRLSLHSGSDKFSVYPLLKEVTSGSYHIKTSGTSWLEAIRLVASVDADFFEELYTLCLDNLIESKKAYQVYITPGHFPECVPADIMAFFNTDEVRQLFHISYGVLLDNCKDRLYETLRSNEAKHYEFVRNHIEKHLNLL